MSVLLGELGCCRMSSSCAKTFKPLSLARGGYNARGEGPILGPTAFVFLLASFDLISQSFDRATQKKNNQAGAKKVPKYVFFVLVLFDQRFDRPSS